VEGDAPGITRATTFAWPWLAFGSLEFLAGQIAGKAWVIALSIPLMMLLKERDERLGLVAPLRGLFRDLDAEFF